VNGHVELLEADLQLLRDYDAILKREGNLVFKLRVREELQSIKEDLARLGTVVGSA
jgi:hypothetical protein